MSLNLEIVIPPLPRVVRGKPVVFGADPKGTYLLYPNGNSVVLRNLQDPTKNDMYTQHSGVVHVAKYSPSGFYVASADKFGKIRIWDTVNEEHILKNEFQPFVGPVCDLAWTSDNQRIIVGGTGQAKFGAVFNAETGASVGEIMGVSRNINSVDFRPVRPYRAVTGNDEGLVTFFEGPPFIFKHSSKTHNAFVNVVRYCPTGTCLVSAGADGKIFVYDGENGETLGEVGSPAHKGGVYGAAFSKDGSRFVSASADKTLKLWRVDGKEFILLSEYSFGSAIANMVLGCEWVNNTIAAVTFDTSLHLFSASDLSALDSPRTIYYGHSMHITCAVFDPQTKRLFTASSDASVGSWDMEKGQAEMFSGAQAHTAQVQGMGLISDKIVTVGFDDRCVLSDVISRSYVASAKLPSQPHAIGVLPGRMKALVACDQHLVLLTADGNTLRILEENPVSLGSCTVSVSSSSGIAAICCSTGEFLTFRIENDKLVKVNFTNAPSVAPVLASFSPDGSILAFADTDRQVTVHNVHEDGGQLSLSQAVNTWWQKHSARITALSWSPSGQHLATGSLDTAVIVWSLDKPKDAIVLRNAHPMSNSTSLSWMNDSTLISTAHDGSIRRWKVSP